MAEGDTILRTACRLRSALGGERLAVRARHPRADAAGVQRLDGRRLESVRTHGKHLMLDFGDLILHSHLGMNGSWRVRGPGTRWERPAGVPWVTLAATEREAVQFGGPTLRVLSSSALRRDRLLNRLGPDVLAPELDEGAAIRSLRTSSERQLGDALLDQSLIAGIGNIFKSEACFAANASPWRPVGDYGEAELRAVLDTARDLMRRAVKESRPEWAVYRRAGRPCRTCGAPIAARGQGDANRRTYWCPRCQPG